MSCLLCCEISGIDSKLNILSFVYQLRSCRVPVENWWDFFSQGLDTLMGEFVYFKSHALRNDNTNCILVIYWLVLTTCITLSCSHSRRAFLFVVQLKDKNMTWGSLPNCQCHWSTFTRKFSYFPLINSNEIIFSFDTLQITYNELVTVT